jgi:MFS family permease
MDAAGTVAAGHRRRNVVAAIVVMALASMTYGMSVPLMGLALYDKGVSSTMIGLSASIQALAVFVVAPLVSRGLRAWGPARLLIGVLVIEAAVYVLMGAYVDVWAWFPLRFLLGAAGSAMWIAGEAWINQVAGDRMRGRILSINSMAIAAGFAAGPSVLAFVGTDGWIPFLVLAGVTAAMILPCAAVVQTAEAMEGEPGSGVFRFVFRAPVPVLISGLYAAVDGILLTFLPIYAEDFGIAEQNSLLMISALGVGGIAGQVPCGWLIDKLDRYRLITLGVLLLIAGAAVLPFAIADPVTGIVYFGLFGAIHGGVYTAGMAILGAEYRGADLATGSSALGVAWGAGVMAGPAIGGVALRAVPEIGLPLCIGLALVAFLPFPATAVVRRRRGWKLEAEHEL